MAPAGRRIGDDFVDDSDSDVSITGLDDDGGKGKGKGKGKGPDKRKKDKGKGKAKDVSCRVYPHPFIYLLTCSFQQAYAWEATYTRSWDTVQEDEGGRLEGAVQDLIARGRRRRCVLQLG